MPQRNIEGMMMNIQKFNSDQENKIQVKICGTTDSHELSMLDRIGVDYAGLWFNVPQGKYTLDRQKFIGLARTPVNRLQCIGVTTESDPDVVSQLVRESGVTGIQLHGFQFPAEVVSIKRRLGDSVTLLKVLHIQNGKCLEKPLLKEYARCGADAFILDNFISRERSGSTGQRIPTATVAGLVELFGSERVFLAGGLDEQGIRDLRSNLPLRGVDIDSGARVQSRIDGRLVMGIVAAAGARVN
ncbi:MAG: phosphoribosylanthranilate isomerase [Methylococcales bacterium]